MPASSSRSVPSSRTSGLWPVRGVDPGREEVVRALETLPLGRWRVHGRAGRLGELGHARDVVEIAVRDEDRGAARAGERLLDPLDSPGQPGSTTTASSASGRRMT